MTVTELKQKLACLEADGYGKLPVGFERISDVKEVMECVVEVADDDLSIAVILKDYQNADIHL